MDSSIATYKLAGIGTRFMALLIDHILTGIIGGFVGANGDWMLGGILGFAVAAGYQWFFLTRNSGQTPGKMFTNIRVVKSDGTAISDIDAVLRYVGYLINSPFFMLGWFWAFFDPQRQGWHDKLARTYVVVADREKVKVVDTDKRKNENY
jgi:uncharacterized RDD family membrane protein YckC